VVERPMHGTDILLPSGPC